MCIITVYVVYICLCMYRCVYNYIHIGKNVPKVPPKEVANGDFSKSQYERSM